MKFEKINIGLLIEQKMNELGVSKSEMARRSGIANQNINRVLERTSIDTDKLVAISEALNFNFFDCFHTNESNTVTAHHFSTNASSELAVLQERVKSLEALLAEKERLISVLMEVRK